MGTTAILWTEIEQFIEPKVRLQPTYLGMDEKMFLAFSLSSPASTTAFSLLLLLLLLLYVSDSMRITLGNGP